MAKHIKVIQISACRKRLKREVHVGTMLSQEYVLFLDPNDASIPSQQRTVYRMNYADLAARIMMQTGVQITDANQHPEDGFYAVCR